MAFQPEAQFAATTRRRGNPFYEKFKFAAREKPRELKYYIKFVIFRPEQLQPAREKIQNSASITLNASTLFLYR